MAYYNSIENKVVYFTDTPVKGYPGWVWRDHGCSNGLKWNTETPIECECASGFVAFHKKSKVVSLYPGGPFV